MSSTSSNSLSLLAEAILCLGAGNPLPSSITDALRVLSPAAVEPVAVEPVAATLEPVVEAPPALAPSGVKEKKIRKTTAAVAAAAAPAAVAAEPAAAVGGDPWRTHPSRLKVIDSTRCTGRRIDTKNALFNTRKGDPGYNNGMVFPEGQCKSKPVPGSKLCASCAAKDTTFKADPNTEDPSWYGRIDEESLYPRAKVVGCQYFLEKYPNGILNDPFRPVGVTLPAATGTAAAVAATATEPKKRGPKKAAAAATATAPAVVASKTAAVDIASVNAVYKSFMHEGRLHIRNLETNKVYYADIAKNSPEENAVKEQYVGRWVGGSVDLIDDSDDDEE